MQRDAITTSREFPSEVISYLCTLLVASQRWNVGRALAHTEIIVVLSNHFFTRLGTPIITLPLHTLTTAVIDILAAPT